MLDSVGNEFDHTAPGAGQGSGVQKRSDRFVGPMMKNICGTTLASVPQRCSLGLVAALTLCLFLLTGQAYSQVGTDSPTPPAQSATPESGEALLKAVQNPVADVISLPINNQTNFNIKPYRRIQNVISLEPVIPLELRNNWMLVTRIVQPIAWAPYPDRTTGGRFGIGDMNPTLYLSPKKPGALTWGAGPALVIPTATSDILGSGKLSLGPSVVVLAQPGPWTFGALVNNVWSAAGSGARPSVNRMALQYFASYNLKHEWYLTSSPEITADWRATRGNVWTVPFGMGIGKLVTIGNEPIDFSATFYRNAATPAGMSNWSMSLEMTLLFPKKHLSLDSR